MLKAIAIAVVLVGCAKPDDNDPPPMNMPDGGQQMPPATCGNGRIDPGEMCDGDQLDGYTCAGLGLDNLIVDFGRRLATDPHSVDEEMRARLSAEFSDAEIVLLTSFGAIMVATNVVNDALGVPLDGYLEPYRARAA